MTLDQYKLYSNMAVKLFAFMNGKINNINRSCTLDIDMYDNIDNTFGNIRFPNSIFIHIGNIVDYCEKIDTSLNKALYDRSLTHEYIVTTIAWCIAHELFHVEQLLSMIFYKKNTGYRESVEESVQQASWNWVKSNKTELELLTGTTIVIDKLTWDHKPILGSLSYMKAPTDVFYMQTIANIVLRDMNLFNNLKTFKLQNIKNIVISFNGLEGIYIKKDGKYLDDNISDFSVLVYRYCGYYDSYTVNIFEEINDDSNENSTSFIDFTILNEAFNPMILKEK